MKSIVVFFMLLTLVSMAGFYRAREPRIQNQSAPVRVDKKAERDAARKIHRGLDGTRKTIPSEVLETGGDVVRRLEVGLPVLTPNSTPLSVESYLAERVCAADAIIIGTVNDRRSQLTDNETFVFTEYKVSIDTVIKNDPEIPLAPNMTVNVSRLGGELEIHGHHVKAISEAAQPLEVENRYLLFVTFLPDKNTFVANNLAFLLKGENFIGLTHAIHSEVLASGKDAENLIREVQAAAAVQCRADGSTQ